MTPLYSMYSIIREHIKKRQNYMKNGSSINWYVLTVSNLKAMMSTVVPRVVCVSTNEFLRGFPQFSDTMIQLSYVLASA